MNLFSIPPQTPMNYELANSNFHTKSTPVDWNNDCNYNSSSSFAAAAAQFTQLDTSLKENLLFQQLLPTGLGLNFMPNMLSNKNNVYFIDSSGKLTGGTLIQTNPGNMFLLYSPQNVKADKLVEVNNPSLQHNNSLDLSDSSEQLLFDMRSESMDSLTASTTFTDAVPEFFPQTTSTPSLDSLDTILPVQACQPHQQFVSSSNGSILYSNFSKHFALKQEEDDSALTEIYESQSQPSSEHSYSCLTSPIANDSFNRRKTCSEPFVTDFYTIERAESGDNCKNFKHQLTSKHGADGKSKSKKSKPVLRNCPICQKVIRRDISRHLRTHELVSRFQCIFPEQYCRHRTGQFNRPYDFKKHLLNSHFKFDDPNIKKRHNLKEKLEHIGTCSCGLKFTATAWLQDHILTKYPELQCPYIMKNRN